MILQVEIYENFREVKQNQKLFYVIREKAKTSIRHGQIRVCDGKAHMSRPHSEYHRKILAKVPRERIGEVAPMLKGIQAQESKEAVKEKAEKVIARLVNMRLRPAAQTLKEGIGESLTYMAFPRNYWIRIRTNNALERMNREIWRRTRVVGNFP